MQIYELAWKQPAIAGQDRDPPHKTLAFESAQRRDFFQSRPVLMLEHHARRIVDDDAPDHAGVICTQSASG